MISVHAPGYRHPFAHLYGRIALHGAGSGTSCLAHVTTGAVSVDQVVVAHPRDADAPPFHALCLRFAPFEPATGPHRMRRVVRQPPAAGDVALMCHRGLPHRHDAAVRPDSGQETRLDAAVVDTSHPHAPPSAGHFREVEHLPVAPDAAEQLDATVACLHNVLDHTPGGGQDSVLLDSSARLLAASLLGCMPQYRGDNGQHRTTTLQRAIDFIQIHADQPLELADIAAATGVTARAVQYAFAGIDTTPLGYLRDTRIARAHTDLQHAGPTTHTVTDIAQRWHFTHPGRFADYYRAAYGTYPSTTLNRPAPAP